MVRQTAHRRRRSGITLTEILISILIMGVGIISLATLFPLGLLRLREAQRSSRSAFLIESATADLNAQDLLSRSSFTPSNLYPSYDPWLQDPPFPPATTTPLNRKPLDPTLCLPPYSNLGPGLPVAYDPLWRAQSEQLTGIYPAYNTVIEGRFGSGIGFLRNDPNPSNPRGGGGSALPSAHGLQRLTNFDPKLLDDSNNYVGGNGQPRTLELVTRLFVSPEDIVLNAVDNTSAGSLSPLLPDRSIDVVNTVGRPINDWRFSWIFTGHQVDCGNETVIDGEIVVYENRPFGVKQQTAPITNQSVYVPEGETVVEGVFGYGTNFPTTTLAYAHAIGADRTVLLRWPATIPDPDVRVGSWIADVTYERVAEVDFARRPDGDFPYQRCHWYQIVKRTQPGPARQFTGDPVDHREMTVWVSTPVKAKTLMNRSTGQPYHVNAALIAPNVVNVFPRLIHTR